MITLEDLSVTYSGKPALQATSLRAAAGELIALVGPNGSGKSTLLKAMTGLIPFDGVSSVSSKPKERAKQIAYLAQDCVAPEFRKVQDIIALGRTPYLGPLSKLQPSDREAITKAATLCQIQNFLVRDYGTLSGGEKMRVHLARTLATDAAILLADEPIAALDPYYQISVMKILREIADQNKLVIAALHDLNLAKRFADRVWVLKAGHVVANDTPDKALGAKILKDVFRITPDGDISS